MKHKVQVMSDIGPGAGGGRWRVWLALAVVGLWTGCRPPPLAPLPPIGTCSAPLEAPALGAWTAGPSAPTRRTGGLMMTLSGGRVLFAGGRVGDADAPCVTDVELFEPTTMAWRKLAPLPMALCKGEGAELPSGRVFVGVQVPGPQPREKSRDGSATFVSFDPTTDRWTKVANVAPPFNIFQLVPIGDREVLIVGYDEVYGLHTFTWTGTTLEQTRTPAQATFFNLMTVTAATDRSVRWFLSDSSVVASAAPNLWNPATASWARADDLPPDSAGCRIVARGASHRIGNAARDDD